MFVSVQYLRAKNMMLGIGLGAVMTAQVVAAMRLWPAMPAGAAGAKVYKPLREEEKNELVKENKELAHQLADMTRDNRRLESNEAAAIEKRDEYQTERDDLQVRYDDLLKECRRLQRASVRAEIKGGDDKKD